MVSKQVSLEQLKQEVIVEHDKIRKDPQSYVKKLEARLKNFRSCGMIYQNPGEVAIITNEGTAAIKEIIEFLKKLSPVSGGVTHSDELAKAAQDHANDLGPKGDTGHTGSDGSKMGERIERYCEWETTIGENIDFGSKSGDEVMMSLITDDGVPSRGHRKNIFKPQFKYVGVGVANHKQYGTCIVLDYAGGIGKSSGKTGSKIPTGNIGTNKLIDKFKDMNLEKSTEKNPTTIHGKNPFKDDPDAPSDAISCDIKISTKTVGKKTTKTTVKTYKTKGGSTMTKTFVEET